jgi:uncharacterized protein (DUF2267 family)
MTTGIPELDRAAPLAEQWVAALAQRLDWQDRAKAYLALRAASHALRDSLPLEEAVHLASHLPTLLRGTWFEGWRPTGRAYRIRDRAAFLERIEEGVHRDPAIDAEAVARALLALLAERLPEPEIEDAKAVTPEPLRGLWPAWGCAPGRHDAGADRQAERPCVAAG